MDQNGKKQKWPSNIQLLLKSPKAESCTRVGVQQNVDGSTIAIYLQDQKEKFFQFQILLNQINVDFKFNAPIVFANTNQCYQNATLTPHSCSLLVTLLHLKFF